MRQNKCISTPDIDKSYVCSTLLYCAEVWTLTKSMEGKINAFKMWCYGRLLRVKWAEKYRWSCKNDRDKEVLVIEYIKEVTDVFWPTSEAWFNPARYSRWKNSREASKRWTTNEMDKQLRKDHGSITVAAETKGAGPSGVEIQSSQPSDRKWHLG